MTHPIVFRDKDMKIIDSGSAPLLWALARKGLERIDLYPAGRRKCAIGFAWADGATGIGDIPWSAEATTAWLELRGVGRLVRQHIGRRK